MSENENRALAFAKEHCVQCSKNQNCIVPCIDAIHMMFFDCKMAHIKRMEEMMKNARQRAGL